MSEQELRIDGATRIYGILGHPVRSSLSPAMHNAAFRALGINAAYVPFPVSPEHFPEVVRALLLAGVSGFNLTVPHKIAILPLLADITPEARAIGAVNTVRCENGSMAATNTDAEGFRLSLERDLAWQPAGKRVLLLGAGGAARAIAFSLLQAGLGELGIANRTPARAEALAADCRLAQAGAKGPAQPGTTVGALELGATAGWAPDLLVNATSVGMGDGKNPVELVGLKVREAVLDIVYTPAETPLLAEAARLGLARANGLGMLLYQGSLAFRFWTGQEAPLAVMRAALEGGLEARKG
ncbi:MAG: shikimate dehydrogenase [SAR324 cluster bacterium]|nr:shikimate dehydrogenase [SAR324 cluster bacterium]